MTGILIGFDDGIASKVKPTTLHLGIEVRLYFEVPYISPSYPLPSSLFAQPGEHRDVYPEFH